MQANDETSVLVAACGNSRRGDDAFGPLVIETLNNMAVDGVATIDLGRRPDRLLDHLNGHHRLIVVDAVVIPSAAPGEIVELNWRAMRALRDRPSGTHGFTLLAQLQFAERLGLLPPDVRLIGVTIEHLDEESPVNTAVLACVPEVAARIVRQCGSRLAKVRM